METDNSTLSSTALELVDKSQQNFLRLLKKERSFPDRLGIILAAGAATRFRPLTASKSHSDRGELENKEHYSVVPWNKASLPIANRPLVSYTIDDLIASGFRYIIINVSRLHAASSIVEAVFNNRSLNDEVAITFLVEDSPSGTYGGVAKMLRFIDAGRKIPAETNIAIFSGDIYTEQPGYQILRHHLDKKAAFTLMLNSVPDEMKDQFGTVELGDSGQIIDFHEKDPNAPTNLNNSSRYITKYGLLNRWMDKITPVPPDKKRHNDADCFFDFGLHIFSRHLKEIQADGFFGFVSENRWADIGRISDFHEINIYTLHDKVISTVHPEAKVTDDCTFEGNYSVEKGVSLSNGALLKDSSVGMGWQIQGAKLERTVLMPLPDGMSYTIGDKVSLTDCVVCCGDINESYQKKTIVFNGKTLVIKDL